MSTAAEPVLPADLVERLASDATARSAFDALAPSHRKEYLAWIDEAKKPETRARRIEETVHMLLKTS